MNRRIILSIFFGIFFSLIITFLFFKQFLYPTILPVVHDGNLRIFADWTVIVSANDCFEKGYDVFLENPCDFNGRKHVYGSLLLYIPFIKMFPNFFYIYLPFILGIFFLISVSYLLCDTKFKGYWPSFLILIFSIPVLLVVERTNIDLIIFIFLLLLCISKNFYLISSLIVISSLSKLYPILLSIIFVFEKDFKKTVIKILTVTSIILIILIFQWDSLVKIFENKSQFSGLGLHMFSFHGIIDFLKHFEVTIGNFDLNFIKYLYLLFFIFVPIFFLNYKYHKQISLIFSNIEIYKNPNFEVKMFFLSSSLILFCFFLIPNFVYREIYILGLIPLIILMNIENKNNFCTFFYTLIVIKFLVTTITTFMFQSSIMPFLNSFLILFKHTVDIYLISIIFHVYIYFIKYSLKKITNQVPQNV